MKWKTIVLLIAVSALSCSLLRRTKQDQKQLDPITVKSPGGFDNLAPESKQIITPEYAAPKVDVNLQVHSLGVVQRQVPLGPTPLPKIGSAFDARDGTFNTVGIVDNKQVSGLTTTILPIHSSQTVSIDMNTGKSIAPLNAATMPKTTHGITDQ